MIAFSCSRCHKRYRVSRDRAGRWAKCPACGNRMSIPYQSEPAGMMQVPAPYLRAYVPLSFEARLRSRNMILLGVVLLVGFLMPIVDGANFEFPNFAVFSAAGAPWQMFVIMLAPGVAGMAMILLARLGRHPVRGIVTVALPLLPVLVLMTDEEVRRSFSFTFKNMSGELILAVLLLNLGWIGLLVGARARWYRPRRGAAYWIGLAGAIAFGVFLMMPIMPAEAGHIPLITAFKMFEAPPIRLVAFGVVAWIDCTVLAGVLCLMTAPGKSADFARRRARGAFLLLIAGAAAFGLCAATALLQNARADDVVAPVLTALIKFGCWGVGMILLLPTGITDLVVGPAPERPAVQERTTL